MKTFWTIKRKLLLFSLCVTLIPISVITVIYYTSARKEIKHQINHKMIAVAESKKLHIEAFLNEIKTRGLDFSSDGYIRSRLEKTVLESSHKQAAITELNRHLKDNKIPLDPNIAAITVLDSSGTVVASTVESIIGENFSDREEYVLIMDRKRNEVLTHPPHFSEYLDHNAVEVSAPITSMNSGETIGIIINAYNQEIINRITSNRKGMGDSGEVVVGLIEGNSIKYMNALRYVPEGSPTLKIPLNEEVAKPMKLALEGLTGTVIGLDYRHIDVIAAYNHISPVGWGLVAKIDKTEAFQPLNALRNTAIILFGICSGVVTTVGIMFSLYTASPINRLKQASEIIAGGKYEHKVKVARKDEIGALADSFNAMTGKLTHEIKEHKKTEIKLIETNKELEAFCYSVSHDLRAPLRGIDGFSRILVEEYAEKIDLQGKDYLKRICAASQKMGTLINDLLDLSRITRGKMQFEHVELSTMVQKIASELHDMEPKRNVDFVITKGLCVNGDTNLLQVAMDNLLNNAWKFTGKHPHARIEFGVKQHNGNPVYFIRDDGVGFDISYSNKLFVAFQRLHSPGEFEGTGIGLATVQRIINRHGGRIWAEGEVGHGATFNFTL